MAKLNIEDLTEIENKYLISKKTAFSLIEKGIKEEKHQLDFINQIYLFEESAFIQYNLELKQFEIQIMHKNKQSDTLIVPVLEQHEQKELNELLLDKKDLNLTKEKGTFRIRYYDGKTAIFAMKMKKEGVAGTLEFEFDITERIKDMENGTDFENILSKIKTRIIKMRHSIEVKDFVYEIDIYSAFEFITLEVEFENENESLAFKEDFKYIKNITFDSRYKNKKMAKMFSKSS